MSPDKLGMRNSIRQLKCRQHLLVHCAQSAVRLRPALEQACGEDAAARSYLQRRRSVGARYRVDHLAPVPDGIDVKDISRDKAFQHEERLLVADTVDAVPERLPLMKFLDSDRPRHEPRLQHPGPRHMIDELCDFFEIECCREPRYAYAVLRGAHPHGQL